MTNEMIILKESVKLMENGVIKGTGEFMKVEEADGTIKAVEMPEAIHTFQAWKSLGYKVKKGEKAVAKFPIWKYTKKEKPAEELTGNPLEDAPITNMFMKVAAFFTVSQVEPVKGV